MKLIKIAKRGHLYFMYGQYSLDHVFYDEDGMERESIRMLTDQFDLYYVKDNVDPPMVRLFGHGIYIIESHDINHFHEFVTNNNVDTIKNAFLMGIL